MPIPSQIERQETSGVTSTGSSPASAGSTCCAATPQPRHGPAGERHRRGLRRVDPEHPAARRAETAEHRDGVHPLPDEDHHCTGHADAAEEERHQGHETEISRELRERLVERLLVVEHGAEPDPSPDRLTAPIRDPLRILSGRDLQVHPYSARAPKPSRPVNSTYLAGR